MRASFKYAAAAVLAVGAAVTVGARANALPQVSLTSPSPVTAPASIVLTATATDSDGTIARVRFYRGTTLLGTDLSAPYSYTWKALYPGDYTFTARAEDNLGGATTSAPVTVKVVSTPTTNVAPSVVLTSPANGATFTAPATLSLAATASDSDGSVAKVEFLNGSTLLATDTVSAYSFSWSSVAAGTYTITARATDNLGSVRTSAPVTVTVASSSTTNAAPAVVLTSPANGASFSAPAAVSLAATASDTDGTIAKVEFLNGTTLLGTDTAAPYSFSWSNVAAGTYSISARATDNRGKSTTSPAASIAVASATQTLSNFYASPSGTASGDGSIQRPWDLKTALNAPTAVKPGSTIWLRGGTYRGSFISYLKGLSTAPIVVRQYPGERAILDGAGSSEATLYVRGYWTWYWGFEVMNSDPRRVSAYSGSSPSDISRNDGILLYGSNVKLINLTIHDTADGVGFWQQAENSEIYGCVIFNNGWLGTDRGHGHGIYAQNSLGTKRIADVISVNNFATGLKAYATSTYATGFAIDGTIAFNNGSPAERGKLYRQPNLFVGTTTNPADRIAISNAHLYHPPQIEPDLGGNLVLGYLAKNNGTISVTDSRVIGGSMALKMIEWQRATFRGNTLYSTSSTVNSSKQRLVELALPAGASTTAYSWTGNEYFDATAVQSSGARLPFVFNGSTKSSFVQWKQMTGFDAVSLYQAGPPAVTDIAVRANRYEAGRAHIVVYNWQRGTVADVDLRSVLSVGARYEVRNAQDFLGSPVASGTYDGGLVRLPLTGLRVATPIGYDFTPASTAPEFAVFVVVPR